MKLELFDLVINIFQSIFVSYYLIQCLDIKYKNMNRIITYMTGFIVPFVYLEVIRYKQDLGSLERFTIFVYLLISLLFSFVMLGGTVAEKLFYNILLLGILSFSSVIGSGIVGLFVGKDVALIVSDTGIDYMMMCIITQVFLVLFALYIIKVRTRFSYIQDTKYMIVTSLIPLISVGVCCFILYNDYQSYNMQIIFTLLSIIGIVVLNIISFILMVIEHNVYDEKIRNEMLVQAYAQKEYDVEEIKQLKNEADKTRHEIDKVIVLLDELISDKKYDRAKAFLDDFIKDKKIKQEQMIYTDNIILNYLLNRKLEQCSMQNIKTHCFVSGIIDGIKDVDLYVLVGNLLDNAIEATNKADNKMVEIRIYSNQRSIKFEIGNSTQNDVIKSNPLFKTTKKDSTNHGFGVNNIMDIVSKYNGVINYKMKLKNVIVCDVTIVKDIKNTKYVD